MLKEIPREEEFLVPLPKEEQIQLLRTYEKSKDPSIKQKLFEHNLRLVQKAVLRYYRSNSFYSLEDAMQDGYLVLGQAIESYRETVDCLFTTYVFQQIRYMLLSRFQQELYLFHFPKNNHIFSLLQRLERLQNTFYQTYGRNPNREELKDLLGISEARIDTLYRYLQMKKTNPVYDQEESVPFLEKQADKQALLSYRQLEDQEERLYYVEKYQRFLQGLKEEDQFILQSRFGFQGKAMTLHEIALQIAKSTEWVRRREKYLIFLLRDYIKTGEYHFNSAKHYMKTKKNK